ncbi:hypothetical protein Btru_017433 [Bulinus truncatus]|nr:hypothetical protein Btru_017433 [Bulinus truncatus]
MKNHWFTVFSTLSVVISSIALVTILVLTHKPKTTEPITFLDKKFLDTHAIFKNSHHATRYSTLNLGQINNKVIKAPPGKYNATNVNSIFAHLGLNSPYVEEDNTDSHPLVVPVSYDPSSALQTLNGVVLKNEGILITRPGSYLVYAGVKFSKNENISCLDIYQTWFFYLIKLLSDGSTETFLRIVFTGCLNDTVHFEATKYTGRVLYLQAGDIIQVKVSLPGVIEFNEQDTYIGLVRLF